MALFRTVQFVRDCVHTHEQCLRASVRATLTQTRTARGTRSALVHQFQMLSATGSRTTGSVSPAIFGALVIAADGCIRLAHRALMRASELDTEKTVRRSEAVAYRALQLLRAGWQPDLEEFERELLEYSAEQTTPAWWSES